MSEHDPVIGQPIGDESSMGAPVSEEPSLADDVKALIEDGKTYLEAELQLQKSRVAFAVDRGKSGALLGLAAVAILHLALIALVVGAIFSLTPLITAWGATAVVVGILVIAAAFLGLAARKRFTRLATVIRETGK